MANNCIHDLFVIYDGINGCGVARDAAGRGGKDFEGDPAEVRVDHKSLIVSRPRERIFAEPVRSRTWSGVSGLRPLFDDGACKAQEVTRDYVLMVDAERSKIHGENGVSVF